MEIFIANLHIDIQEELVAKLFEVFGTVTKSTLVLDKHTGKSKGFGFVVMDNDNEARNAIEDLNGRELAGRILVVQESKPKIEKNKVDTQANVIEDDNLEFECVNDNSSKVVKRAAYKKGIDDDGFIKINFN